MDTKAAFEKWWDDSDRDELRMSCSMGWAYFIWCASRAAIEIELPEEMQEVVGRDVIHGRVMANDMLHDCQKAITSHGIRIKGKTE